MSNSIAVVSPQMIVSSFNCLVFLFCKNERWIKKDMNNFMFFCKANRLRLIRQHKNTSNSDISILLEKEWKGLSSNEKLEYKEKAKQVIVLKWH